MCDTDQTGFYSGKKVLVTGGAGFVGSHFVDALLARNADVRLVTHNRPSRHSGSAVEVVKLDLMNSEDCFRACDSVDCVVHAAGAVAGAGLRGGSAILNGISANLILSLNMLQASVAAECGRFLLFSSSTGYPAYDHAVREEEFWAADVHPAYLGYGWMRRYLEKLGEFVAMSSATGIALVRPTAVYGRHDDFDPETSHVIPALIRRALAKEDPFIVWGGDGTVRDFLHITDFVEGSLLALEKKADCDPVNIGSGRAVSMKRLVSAVLAAAGHDRAKVEYDQSAPVTIPFRAADIAKATNALGFAPRVELEDGIRDTVDWYRSQPAG